MTCCRVYVYNDQTAFKLPIGLLIFAKIYDRIFPQPSTRS